jgi:plastocyanin
MRRLPLVLLATAALAAGCGSDDEQDAVATDTIEMVGGNDFEPKAAAVRVGQRVTWVNVDGVPHNAVAETGGGPKSELLPKGGRYSFTPSEPGRIAYVCTIHPGMEGTLEVTAGS